MSAFVRTDRLNNGYCKQALSGWNYVVYSVCFKAMMHMSDRIQLSEGESHILFNSLDIGHKCISAVGEIRELLVKIYETQRVQYEGHNTPLG